MLCCHESNQIECQICASPLRAKSLGFINVYVNGYSCVWANKSSARGAAGTEHDIMPKGDNGPFLRTVEIFEVEQ